MSYEIKGILKQVFETQEREVKDKKYYSRDFILECFDDVNGQTYSNFPKLTAKGFERC